MPTTDHAIVFYRKLKFNQVLPIIVALHCVFYTDSKNFCFGNNYFSESHISTQSALVFAA